MFVKTSVGKFIIKISTKHTYILTQRDQGYSSYSRTSIFKLFGSITLSNFTKDLKSVNS